jgi:hypothetical protein
VSTIQIKLLCNPVDRGNRRKARALYRELRRVGLDKHNASLFVSGYVSALEPESVRAVPAA